MTIPMIEKTRLGTINKLLFDDRLLDSDVHAVHVVRVVIVDVVVGSHRLSVVMVIFDFVPRPILKMQTMHTRLSKYVEEEEEERENHQTQSYDNCS